MKFLNPPQSPFYKGGGESIHFSSLLQRGKRVFIPPFEKGGLGGIFYALAATATGSLAAFFQGT
jgi:hypothetical protein